MIYLAAPYFHLDPAIRQQRFDDTCRAAARLLASGLPVFSPIVHGHPLVNHGLPTDWSFWQPFDHEFLVRCDELLVLMLVGWRESVGVAAEIRIAGELGKPVRYLAPDATALPTSAQDGTVPITGLFVADGPDP